MKALIDGDILRYEIGFSAETKWKNVSTDPPPFSIVEELLEDRIGNIMALTESDDCILFFTGSSNFRNDIAKTTPYKHRKSHKPFHFKNIEAYLKSKYEWQEEEGLEADDLMAIYQTSRLPYKDTVICTRDKDLRQVEGWHFGWEIGNQPMFPMQWVDKLGWIEYSPSKGKINGVGTKFLCAQALTGDPVDTIPGLPHYGPKKAYKALYKASSVGECYRIVADEYSRNKKDFDYMMEQYNLLYLIRRKKEDGSIESFYDIFI